MKTITDIFIISSRTYHEWHENACKIIGCKFCEYNDPCRIIWHAINDMLKAGEYH